MVALEQGCPVVVLATPIGQNKIGPQGPIRHVAAGGPRGPRPCVAPQGLLRAGASYGPLVSAYTCGPVRAAATRVHVGGARPPCNFSHHTGGLGRVCMEGRGQRPALLRTDRSPCTMVVPIAPERPQERQDGRIPGGWGD